MGSLKKRRKTKINKHKRRKLRANRLKRTWQVGYCRRETVAAGARAPAPWLQARGGLFSAMSRAN